MAWVVSAVVSVASYVGLTVAAIAVSAGVSVSVGLTIWSVVTAGLEMYALSEAMKLITGGPKSSGASPVGASIAQGLLLNATSNVDGIPVIYGTRKVGGSRVLCEVSGASNEYLHIVISLCEGEIDGVTSVYLDDVLTTNAKFAGVVNTYVHTGTDGQTAEEALMAALPTKCTADFKGGGVAYIYVRLLYRASAFQSLPTVNALVRGRKVFDPRTSLTVYSNNPALCIRDYLTHARYGRAIDATQIDNDAIISAANYCDEMVAIPTGTQKRYTCDGVVDINNTAYENLRALLTSCRAILVYSGGLYKLLPDRATTPSFTFDESNIVGSWTIAQPGRRSKFNRVSGGFFNPNTAWQPDYGIADSPAYRALDNNLLLDTKLDLPFTANGYMAQQLAGVHLKQSRFGTVVQFTASQEALRCEVGRVVWITHDTPGWTEKPFRVLQMTLKDDDEVEVSCVEYDPSIYDLDPLIEDVGDTTVSLPDPLRSPTPASLTVTSGTSELLLNSDGTVTSRMRCDWPSPSDVFVVNTEVQFKLTTDSVWQSFAKVDAESLTLWLTPVRDGSVYNVRARFENTIGVLGEWRNASNHTVLGKSEPPSDVGAVAYVVEQAGVRLTWPEISDVDLYSYEIRTGGTSWVDATILGTVATAQYLWRSQVAGSPVVRVKAVDTSGNYSLNASNQTLTVSAPDALSVSYLVVSSNEILSWGIPYSATQVDRYEVRYGPSWIGGATLGTTKATSYQRQVDYGGARTYWVAAIDSVGNVGAAGSVGVVISVPGPVVGLRADIIDNNALLYWGAPASGTLTVDRYEVRKGATWAGGSTIGSNGNSTFTTVFEQASGVYTYWVAAIDSANNYGTPVSVAAFVNQPPDYVLRLDLVSTLGGTGVNTLAVSGGLIAPVNTSETWAQHFVNNGFATPQAQISAGYPAYISPSLSSASYSEVIDYGSPLAATNITATLDSSVVYGSVAVACQIDYSSVSSTGPWTSGAAGATSVVASNFQWVRVTYTFTCTAGANLLKITGLNVKLSVKQRTDSGSGTAAVAGTAVAFGYPFLSADCPMVQPSFVSGAAARFAVVTYVGGANPTGFTVQIFDSAGTDVGGNFSWTVRGY